jgi:hypothetical protein
MNLSIKLFKNVGNELSERLRDCRHLGISRAAFLLLSLCASIHFSYQITIVAFISFHTPLLIMQALQDAFQDPDALQDLDNSILSSPAGRNYSQPSPPPDIAFHPDLASDFERYLKDSTNCSIFTHDQYQKFIWFLENPDRVLGGHTVQLRAKDANQRQFCLRNFELDDGCLYRKAETKYDINGGAITTPRRYVALYCNAFQFITDIHRLLQHFGIQKTYERVSERYYGITRENVAWVVNRCSICNLKAAAKNLAPVTPIVASCCLNHVQIDLMDFSTTPDGIYNYACQLKCPFSRYTTVDPTEDKTAKSVAAIVERWIGYFGRPRRI